MRDINLKIIEPITSSNPILFRRYTLIPDESKNPCTLVISNKYQLNEETSLRDELYGQWVLVIDNTFVLTLFSNVDADSYDSSKLRYDTLLKNLHVYVDTLINSDKIFFKANPNLIPSHISMRFISSFGDFNKTIYYCKVKDFLID